MTGMTSDELLLKHPNLKVDSIDPGWVPVLDGLATEVKAKLLAHGLPADSATYVQVKEKFGALTCFVRAPIDVAGIVERARLRSLLTCETCGRFGRRRPGPWVKTLCDTCDERRGQPYPLTLIPSFRVETEAVPNDDDFVSVTLRHAVDGGEEACYAMRAHRDDIGLAVGALLYDAMLRPLKGDGA
ncbi:hypothetical protein [Ramlibacter sp. 2FC]|uniref:hypothetical protein n=1 Tax=Ramlibacter sp. 2FC TaxID=2502188 RepID=UPI0010F53264|nr:hypothetical protein [Ramlibacter sp. 2FC]